jgi:hypothetical protein
MTETKRILLRSHRDLRVRSSPVQIARENQVGMNSGNLIFAHAVHRALSVTGTEIDVDYGQIEPAAADRINEQYDAHVIPLANAFRPSFQRKIDLYCELIERLTIPTILVGVGVQFNPAGNNPECLDHMLPTIHRFVRAVLERSASIGVRGEVTYRFLRSIGYSESEVTVIGCPSLYQFGPTLNVRKSAELTTDSKLCINVSPYRTEMGPIASSHARRYPAIRYVAQDLATLRTLLYLENPVDAASMAADVPYRVGDPLIADRRTWYFTDPTTWIRYLAKRDFSFGSRIHGNIASLLAGTPAVVLGHDSRTVELADYHQIPYRLLSQASPDVDARELFGWADYTGFNDNQQARFDTYRRFLEANGLEHIFSGTPAAVEGVSRFDQQVARARDPKPVTRSNPTQALMLRAGRRWQRMRVRRLARKGAGMSPITPGLPGTAAATDATDRRSIAVPI